MIAPHRVSLDRFTQLEMCASGRAWPGHPRLARRAFESTCRSDLTKPATISTNVPRSLWYCRASKETHPRLFGVLHSRVLDDRPSPAMTKLARRESVSLSPELNAAALVALSCRSAGSIRLGQQCMVAPDQAFNVISGIPRVNRRCCPPRTAATRGDGARLPGDQRCVHAVSGERAESPVPAGRPPQPSRGLCGSAR